MLLPTLQSSNNALRTVLRSNSAVGRLWVGSIQVVVHLLRQQERCGHGELPGRVEQERMTTELQTAMNENHICHIRVSEPSLEHELTDLYHRNPSRRGS